MDQYGGSLRGESNGLLNVQDNPRNEAVVWALYAFIGMLLLLVSTFIVLFFQPKNGLLATIPALSADEVGAASSSSASSAFARSLRVSSRFVNVVCIGMLYVSLLCLFTPPVDVYLLENSLPHLHANDRALKIMYRVYFGALVLYSFFGAPLMYHYAKQTEIAHVTMRYKARDRFCFALKRTFCFLLGFGFILLLLMVALLCGKPKSSEVDWLKPLLKLSNDLETLLRLLIGILVLFGLFIWIAVCCRGLASVPLVGFLMADHSVEEHRRSSTFQDLLNENAMETQATTRTKHTLLSRYAGGSSTPAGAGSSSSGGGVETGGDDPARKNSFSSSQMSVADRQRLDQLQIREKMLMERKQVLQYNAKQLELLHAQWHWYKVPFGLVLLLCSLLVLTSILLTSVDKLLHSDFHRGFLLNAPQFPNPLDELLLVCSRWFPLDYVVFACVYAFLFLVSFVVLLRHGLRFLCFHLQKLQPRLTPASTMTMVSLVIIYLAMVGLFSLLTLSPQYATFGHQTFVNVTTGQRERCTLEEAAKHLPTILHGSALSPPMPPRMLPAGSDQVCRMSQLASFYNRLAVNMPVFGALFFVGQMVFVAAFVPWFAHAYVMAKQLPDPKRQRFLDDF